MSIQWEAHQFVQQLMDPGTPEDRLGPAAMELMGQLSESQEEDVDAAIGTIAEAIETAPPGRALMAAMLCGAAVEQGANAMPMAGPLLSRLRSIVPLARQFLDATDSQVPKDAEDPDSAFGEAAQKLASRMPQAASAWSLLDRLFAPVMAVMSTSPTSRAGAADLLPDLAHMAHRNEGAHWISIMLRVLHEEPYIAIEPATRRGIEGRMSGVSVNFQLNVLLMDIFPREKGSPGRVSVEAAQVARGEGPQQTEETLHGAWNLYTWRALRPDLTLPEPQDFSAKHDWVWNEGTPTDIDVLQGKRIILLGPPGYERTWRSQRDFSRLPADLTVEQVLSPAAVEAWLKRIAAAPRG